MIRNVVWEKEADYKSRCVVVSIKDPNDTNWYSNFSRLIFFPNEGVFEVDDGRRYYDRCDTYNTDHHAKATAFYEELLKELGESCPYVYVHPDYGGSVGNNPSDYAPVHRERLNTEEYLQEIPFEVMSDEEKDQYVAMFGPVSATNDIAAAINQGMHARVSELLQNESQEVCLKWLKCAVIARSTSCFNAIYKLVDTVPEEFFDIAVENNDKNTIRVFMSNGYKPLTKQLFNTARLGDFELFSYVSL
jgi:hypothetical protein